MRTLIPAIVALITLPASAMAQAPLAAVICDETQIMNQRLASFHRAERSASGLRDPETIMEVWTDVDGAWALVMARSNGTSCIVAMGEAWTAHPTS